MFRGKASRAKKVNLFIYSSEKEINHQNNVISIRSQVLSIFLELLDLSNQVDI